MTKREMFNAIMMVSEVSANEAMVDFLKHEIELLDNKKSSKSTNKKKIAEQTEVQSQILPVLRGFAEGATVTELIKTEELKDYSAQKVSAMLKKMEAAGVVERITLEKPKRTVFRVA